MGWYPFCLEFGAKHPNNSVIYFFIEIAIMVSQGISEINHLLFFQDYSLVKYK